MKNRDANHLFPLPSRPVGSSSAGRVKWGQSPISAPFPSARIGFRAGFRLRLFFRLSGPADGQRAKAPADEALQFAHERIAAQRPATMGGQADAGQFLLILRRTQRRGPVPAAGLIRPPFHVQQAGCVDAPAAVGGCARPRVLPRGPHHLGAERVPLDVPHRRPEVPAVQRAGIEAVLPQVPAAAVKAVDRLGVPEVGPAETLGQRLLGARDGDQVDAWGGIALATPPGWSSGSRRGSPGRGFGFPR